MKGQDPRNAKGNEIRQITVENIQFSHLKNRLLIDSSVYISPDKSTYLKIGGHANIIDEINISRDLRRRGFPVPSIVSTGMLSDGTGYYIEESIGEKVFGDIFKEETIATGAVSDISFNNFISVIQIYCRAQFDPKNYVPRDIGTLETMIGLENVLTYNPPPPEMRDRFLEAYHKATRKLSRLPWGYTQADLNVFNILPGGIIDFELATAGPIGYDVLTCIYFGKMWPEDQVAYRILNDQILRYCTVVDNSAAVHGVHNIGEYLDDFLVLKAIWGTAKKKRASQLDPQKDLDFWTWRVRVRDWCIRQYLAGKKIDTDRFEEVGSPELVHD